MAPNTSPSTALALSLLLLLLSTSFAGCPCGPPKVKTPPKPPKVKPPIPCPPTPVIPTPKPPTPKPPTPSPPIIGIPTPPTPTPTPPTPTPPKSCPIDTLKLGVCGDLLGGLVHIIIGGASNTPCCSLIGGLADLDAALCLCTALKAGVLGINLNIPVNLSLLLNYCGKDASGYKCI